MAAIAGVDLRLDEFGSGATLQLARAPRAWATRDISAQAQIELVAGEPLMVVRDRRRGQSVDDQLLALLDSASKGLDIAAVSGVGAHFLVDSMSDHVLWSTDSEGRVDLRLQVSAWSGLHTTPAALGPTSSRPSIYAWDESLRYFRLSQATDDLFDAHRNLFLALESILSLKTPQERKEPEGEWLKRAWRAAAERVWSSPDLSDPLDLSDAALTKLKNVRNALSHAKRGREPHVPEQAASRTAVRESIAEIARVYLALLELDAGLPVTSGGLTDDGAGLLLDGLSPLTAIASRADGVEVRRWKLDQRPAGAPRERQWASAIDVSVDETAPVTIAIEACLGRAISAPRLGVSLDLRGVARFEVVVVVGFAPSRVRTLYPS